MKHKRKRKSPILLRWALFLALGLALLLVLTGMRRHADVDGLPEALQGVYDRNPEARSSLPEALQEVYDQNPEARSSLTQYQQYKDADPVIDLSDEAFQGVPPLLLQWDVRWAFRNYNQSYMAATGCGPTCLSMALIGLTGDGSYDPWTLAQYAESAGYSVPGSGTSWSFIPDGAAHYGRYAEELPLSEDIVAEALRSGKYVVLVVGPGDFTTTGHYLLLTGVENGKFQLNDPNSPKNSEKDWSWERLSPQIQNLWAIG